MKKYRFYGLWGPFLPSYLEVLHILCACVMSKFNNSLFWHWSVFWLYLTKETDTKKKSVSLRQNGQKHLTLAYILTSSSSITLENKEI